MTKGDFSEDLAMILALSSEMNGLIGGGLIGAGSLLAFVVTRKVPGISGVFSRILQPKSGDVAWRCVMILGLILGAGLAFRLVPGVAEFDPPKWLSVPYIIGAGLLVGFGTRLGGGCTSGHGVCGMSRGVRDSIIATCIFMGAAMVTVWVMKMMFAGGAQ
jgi:uncharacterized membrane protein YedE/YeeE